nr:hypothetical protein [Tanacetum cinerariifolium]
MWRWPHDLHAMPSPRRQDIPDGVKRTDDLEPDEKSVDTPLASLFLDSNDDSDDGDVLNELEEHSNAGQLCRQRDEVSPKSNNDMPLRDKMDDPNITMEDYIRLKEEKAHRSGKVFNWETAKYGKIWFDEDVLDLRSVETEFLAIVFNDNFTSNEIPSCEPTEVNRYGNANLAAGFTRMRVYYSEELKYAVGLGYKVVHWCGETSAIKEKRELVGLILQIKELTYMHVDDDLWLGVKVIRACMSISSLRPLIMEYMVNISKRRAFWNLNKDILKITFLTTNTPYPSRKMLHICACTRQRPQRKPVQYAVFSEDQYVVLKI